MSQTEPLSPVLPGTGGASIPRVREPFSVDGELTIENIADLRRIFVQHLEDGADVVVVDFSHVLECDCAAIQLLCSLRKTTVQGGRGYRVTALSPAILSTAANLGVPVDELAGSSDGGGNTDGV